jgi:negative regulator of flagellin synthesis FlgM
MYISRTQIQNLFKVYNKDMNSGKNSAAEVKSKKVAGDDLALSGESKIMQRALLAVKQADDIRQDKVNALREQVSAGTYSVSDDEVAETMISQALLDQMV